ncbi:TPA: phage holin family protein [Enterobacter bugandensis]|nr:phage holin family protein [Enterobacter bugandensis]
MKAACFHASTAVSFWVLAFIVSLWGGCVRYLIDRRTCSLRISKAAVLRQVIISAFNGFLGGLYSHEYESSVYMSLLTVGICSTLGSTLLRFLWSRFTDVSSMKDKH